MSENEDNKDKNRRKLTPEFENLLEYYTKVAEFEAREVVSPVHVDELASRFALLYEQVRKIIDWKEDHLIRRTAIERSLKRRMISKLYGISLLSGVTGKDIAKPLVYEIVRAGYFPNDSISQSKVVQVERAMNKYIYILSNSSVLKSISPFEIKKKVNFYNWIVEVAACEIDEILSPPLREIGVINFMTNMMVQRVKLIPDGQISKEDKVIQTYISVHKTLYGLDEPIIAYNLLKYRYPKWISAPDEIIKDFTQNIVKIWKGIETDLSHPKAGEFYKVCENYDATYLVLGDTLNRVSEKETDLKSRFEDWNSLKDTIKEVYDERISTLRSRLSRSAIFSTLSIFLAGGISLFMFEVPLAKLFLGEFSPLAIFVDIMIPTVLMFILVSIIRTPKKKNFDRVLEEVRKVIYKTPVLDVYEVKLTRKGKFARNIIFGFIYFLTTIISFGGVFYLFHLANVPWTSLYVDTANIAVIVFAAIVIRQKAKEVTIEDNAGVTDFFIDIFSIPLGKLGQWLASKWKEYNFVSVFFTALIDMPIMTFVEVIEDWRDFLKDKKSGIH